MKRQFININLIVLRKEKRTMKKRKKQIIIDGRNVLLYSGIFNMENIKSVRKWASKEKIDRLIVFPKTKDYTDEFNYDMDVLFSNVDDDTFLIQYAIKEKIPILSNDKFKEFISIYPEFDFNNMVFRFDIVKGIFITDATNYFRKLFLN